LEGGLDLALEQVDERRAWLRVRSQEHEYEARAAALAVPYPSGLRRLMAWDPDVEVVLLEQASRRFDGAAAEQQVGYLDLRGRGRLLGPGFVYVAPPYLTSLPAGGDIEDSSAPDDQADPWARVANAKRSHPSVSPFAPKASRVVRVLLSDPERPWRLSDIADRCQMNPGNVHRVLRALVDQAFIERDRDLYVLDDPGSLLEAWADHAGRRRSRDRLAVPVREGLRVDVERVLAAVEGHGFVSGELAAELYAPHLPAAQAVVHCVEEEFLDRERLVADFGPRPLRPQGQVLVDLADDGIADSSEVRDGLPLVSPAQVYVDLARDRSRGREAAEHVRREVLGY
jgi:AraC-like DNA-binding protein